MPKKFPKAIALHWEQDTNDEGWWVVQERPDEHAELGKPVDVGVYLLQGTCTVTAETKVTIKAKGAKR